MGPFPLIAIQMWLIFHQLNAPCYIKIIYCYRPNSDITAIIGDGSFGIDMYLIVHDFVLRDFVHNNCH